MYFGIFRFLRTNISRISKYFKYSLCIMILFAIKTPVHLILILYIQIIDLLFVTLLIKIIPHFFLLKYLFFQILFQLRLSYIEIMVHFQVFMQLLSKFKSLIAPVFLTLKNIWAIMIVKLMFRQEIFVFVNFKTHIANVLDALVCYRL